MIPARRRPSQRHRVGKRSLRQGNAAVPCPLRSAAPRDPHAHDRILGRTASCVATAHNASPTGSRAIARTRRRLPWRRRPERPFGFLSEHRAFRRCCRSAGSAYDSAQVLCAYRLWVEIIANTAAEATADRAAIRRQIASHAQAAQTAAFRTFRTLGICFSSPSASVQGRHSGPSRRFQPGIVGLDEQLGVRTTAVVHAV